MALKIDNSKDTTKYRRSKLMHSKGLAVAKTRVLLIVDGKTERLYFKKLEELNIFLNIKFKMVIGDETNYKNIFKENLDIVNRYIILDVDNCVHDQETRTLRIRTLIESKKTKHITYYNNYAFETFLLNHIYMFAKPIGKKEEYDKDMNKHFGVKSWSNNKDERQINMLMKKNYRTII